MFLKCDSYRVWCSIFYSKLVNCILLRSLFVFVKGRGTCGSGERNVKIWIDFRKSPRFSLTSSLSQVALFLLCVVSPGHVTVCGLLEWKQICAGFISFIYAGIHVCICCWRSNYQEGRDGMTIDLTLPHICSCLKQDMDFLNIICHKFLCSISWGDGSFCWYFWHCWPSVFKLFFIIYK
jgi:hypothetical protein